jgi:hypothetical protein
MMNDECQPIAALGFANHSQLRRLLQIDDFLLFSLMQTAFMQHRGSC